jgi:hypothetical protein
VAGAENKRLKRRSDKVFSLCIENIGISAETIRSHRSLRNNSIIEQSIELYNEHLRRAAGHDED